MLTNMAASHAPLLLPSLASTAGEEPGVRAAGDLALRWGEPSGDDGEIGTRQDAACTEGVGRWNKFHPTKGAG